ncbi:MAG: UPF0280 family protein [Desulfobacterales bacterium]|nr:UPF0280 family protein [Desulfobacterales bacterium]
MDDRKEYRKFIKGFLPVSFQTTVLETNLLIHAEKKLEKISSETVLKYRNYISQYILNNHEFQTSLSPLFINEPCHKIIKEMSEAGILAGVGPMAAVAGIIAEYTGRELLKYSNQVIVENGGDTFIKVNKPLVMGIYAGNSPLSMKIGIKINETNPLSVCTSSGTIGHSLSKGKSDAVCVISKSGAIADASATSIGNLVKKSEDISYAIDYGKKIDGVRGIIVIIDDKIGAWGDIDLIKL